jgi:tetratricopeptide (TPR) repeat protein
MRSSTRNLILSIAAVAITAVVVGLLISYKLRPRIEDILAVYNDKIQYGGLAISYPPDGTLFPPDIAPPTLRWKEANNQSDTWLIAIEFGDNSERLNFLSRRQQWTPLSKEWEEIKKRSLEKQAEVTILGIDNSNPKKVLSAGRILIKTSKDPVGAPLFYREVNLPFVDAVKDPSRIQWRFGLISSLRQPPIVLKNLPVCGNCHSFSANATTLAMDIDYANSKGSYVITRVAEQMTLATSNIITWNDYKKEDGKQTFGLLSQISPDGRFAASTVKDRSVFVPRPGTAFSQLFFPIKGILCIYDTQNNTFAALPGADDPNYVQSNPAWSPDGKYIVFAKTKAYELRNTRGPDTILLTHEECKEFLEEGKQFLFDLYRIPFNDGKGGEPLPLEGAFNNGMSNYFARYSPDGKWIVFCKAKSYMLLQSDSELYIIPADGGQARRLQCNTSRMNSWHSWSPNSRWLVFSSKANTDYTQLFLTHIDQEGNSSPPVLLSQFTAPDRAANIPEFVNTSPAAIRRIHEKFLDDYSFVRAGNEFFKAGDTDNAIPAYRKALELNPNNIQAHLKLGFLLYNVKERYEEGMEHYEKALQIDPNDPRIHHDLGMAFLHQRKFDEAINHLSEALRKMPYGISLQYNAVNMHQALGMAFFHKGNFTQASAHLSEAARLDPNNARVHYDLAVSLAAQGKIDEPVEHYSKAVSLNPDVDRSALLHDILGMNYARAGRFREAFFSAQKALKLARAVGDTQLAAEIEQRIELYKQNKSLPDFVITPGSDPMKN